MPGIGPSPVAAAGGLDDCAYKLEESSSPAAAIGGLDGCASSSEESSS